MNIQMFQIDNSTKFNVVDGEIFGVGGSGKFVTELYAAVTAINSDSAISSVITNSGFEIKRIK